MIYVIEILNKDTGEYSYVHRDVDLYCASSIFTAVRYESFEEARNEYQRLLSAPNVLLDDNTQSLPILMRTVAKIDGVNATEATLTVSILENDCSDWPSMKVNRIVNHTVHLSERNGVASVKVD